MGCCHCTFTDCLNRYICIINDVTGHWRMSIAFSIYLSPFDTKQSLAINKTDGIMILLSINRLLVCLISLDTMKRIIHASKPKSCNLDPLPTDLLVYGRFSAHNLPNRQPISWYRNIFQNIQIRFGETSYKETYS